MVEDIRKLIKKLEGAEQLLVLCSRGKWYRLYQLHSNLPLLEPCRQES
jgi:hypothetical protein